MAGLKKYLRLNPRISVFISCVFVSILFWLMIVFSKDYTTKIKLKAEYLNIPNDKVVSYKLPDSLDLEINGVGFSLFSLSFKDFPQQIIVDLGQLKKNKRNFEAEEYTINLSQQLGQVSDQFTNFGIKVTKIFPEQVSFYFDAKAEKIIKVIPNFKYSFAPNFSINGAMSYLPKKMLIKGPKLALSRIDSLTTTAIEINDLNKDFLGFYDLLLPKELSGIEMPAKKIAIVVPVEKYTETEMEIPIQVMMVPKGFSIKTFPEKIKVIYSVGLSKYKSIKPSDFKVTANGNNVDSLSNVSMLKVKLEEFPLEVKNCRLQTEKVEFIIKRN